MFHFRVTTSIDWVIIYSVHVHTVRSDHVNSSFKNLSTFYLHIRFSHK